MSTATQIPQNPGPIIGAGQAGSIGAGAPLPNVQDSVRGWFKPMKIGVVTAMPQASGLVRQSVNNFNTAGVIMPGNSEDLKILKEGERSWRNGVLYTEPQFNVGTDSMMVIDGINYRVLKKRDFSAYGYVRYFILEDYAVAS